MATLVLKWGSPLVDHNKVEENPDWQKLDESTRAVLSMRAVACEASLLPQTYHLWLAADGIVRSNEFRDFAHQVLCLTLRESMLDQLLIRLRRTFMDVDQRTVIGGAQLPALLAQDEVVATLRRRREDPRNMCQALSNEEVDKLIAFIRARCGKLRPSGTRKSQYWRKLDSLSLEAQAYLLLKAADWKAAHLSMDEYKFGESDLRAVLFTAMMIARAIQRVSGDDSTDSDYADIDRVAYENATAVVGVAHRDGLLLDCLDQNLDMHLGRIEKSPPAAPA